MGGVAIDLDCRTNLEGLFVAGEDAGGVHGANRLGGNGVADSIVYGGRAGDSMADYVTARGLPNISDVQVQEIARRWCRPLTESGGGEKVFTLRTRLEDLMWEKAGVVRNGGDLSQAAEELSALSEQAETARTPGPPASNPEWNDAMNLINLCKVGEMVARSALIRTESRGAHYRQDFPAADPQWLQNIYLTAKGDDMEFSLKPVKFTRLSPSEIGAKTHAIDLRHD
jgi:succinate dehydrogenase / fumarate reductase flavoprotein subunit/fumarate reductase flavoprotein subunit